MQKSANYLWKSKRPVENWEQISLHKVERRANLIRLKNEMKEEFKLNNNLWTEKTISGLNENISENFSKAVKRFNQPKIGISVPMQNK